MCAVAVLTTAAIENADKETVATLRVSHTQKHNDYDEKKQHSPPSTQRQQQRQAESRPKRPPPPTKHRISDKRKKLEKLSNETGTSTSYSIFSLEEIIEKLPQTYEIKDKKQFKHTIHRKNNKGNDNTDAKLNISSEEIESKELTIYNQNEEPYFSEYPNTPKSHVDSASSKSVKNSKPSELNKKDIGYEHLKHQLKALKEKQPKVIAESFDNNNITRSDSNYVSNSHYQYNRTRQSKSNNEIKNIGDSKNVGRSTESSGNPIHSLKVEEIFRDYSEERFPELIANVEIVSTYINTVQFIDVLYSFLYIHVERC